MNNKSKSVLLTQWVNRGIMALLALLVAAMPRLLQWYNTLRLLSQAQNRAILIAFYVCVPVVLWALWSLDRLLRNIQKEQVFTRENVRLIGHVCLCCAGVALICLPASVFYPPLIFMVVIMGFLCPVIRVVRQVICAAVDIREENDLTI